MKLYKYKTVEYLYDRLLTSVDASYAEQKGNWYAISGSNGYGLHYVREAVGPGSINTLEFYVPHELVDKYADYLSNMNTYFEAGNLDESH